MQFPAYASTCVLWLVSCLYMDAAAAERTLRETNHVFIVIGGHVSDLQWVRTQKEMHGVDFIPVLVNPHPKLEPDELREAVKTYNGTFYHAAAWTADDEEKTLYMSKDETMQGGLDSLIKEGSRHKQSVQVRTVDIARVIREHTLEGDTLVMRMDVEGSEYSKLQTQGLLILFEEVMPEALPSEGASPLPEDRPDGRRYTC
eukprot:TRINITY_DN42645_c0_g1_i2.p1 TRINITY_DN42645_c0_g1~~TRINITY_DN42645_c0_g1_i2.p1  ORF type:complete len:201 (-),score=33.24 TRINITY_DN42645_c0_g1_i2:24-626(-)